METEVLTALFTFALVSSITPGPNNIMLMSSGTNFGFRQTLPHMLGVNIGFTLMVILVGIGLMEIFTLYPFIQSALKFVSVSYLVYLSYKIATSAPHDQASNKKAKPFSFIQAALFQWVNPKAWTMALSATTLYTSSNSILSVLQVALVYGAVNLPCVSAWVFLGKQIRRALNSHSKLKIFNWTMAGLLISSLYFLL